MAVHTGEQIIKKAKKTGRNGVRVALSAEELAQAGIQPGDDILLEVRRYTVEDWIRDNEGRVYYSEAEFDAAMAEAIALPEG
jgi:hypothetical protein